MNAIPSQPLRLTTAGSYPIIDTHVVTPSSRDAMIRMLPQVEHCIPRGAGQGIGDGALNSELVVSARGLDRMLAFDEQTGVLVAEAGVILADIVSSFSARSWFLPTTPGTNQISLGGAVASDVHGKNHHAVGSFARHVLWIDILTATQGLVRCSPTEHQDLFYTTCGGMGLTGIILAIAIKLVRIPSDWIKQIGIKTRSLIETLEACEEYYSYSYSVAWIDPHARGEAMGRGYLMCGEFAQEQDLKPKSAASTPERRANGNFKLPMYFPVPLISLPLWTQIINGIYYLKSPKGVSQSVVSAEEFFFPLQHINLKMFGGGHITYQFVLPFSASREGLKKIFETITQSGQGSFVSVLKLFGRQDPWPGNISFPMEGYNLGIDFIVSSDMFKLFRELDAIVLDHGGRHYLTKDVCLSAEGLRRGYGKAVDEFVAVKRKWDPDNSFRSLQSMRLELY